MDQAGIIRDLPVWLEGYLDQPPSLDNIAAKTSYSKWHLQRMFKGVTGHAIGVYIRTRRPSKSAVTLCLATRPTLDTVLQYRSGSQQTSTRASKEQFAQTPTSYRRSPKWSAFDTRPSLRLGESTMLEHKLVTLEDTPLTDVTQSYFCLLEQISDFRHEMRHQLWHDLLDSVLTIPPVLYGLNETRLSRDKDDEQEVFYTTTLAQGQADGYVPTGHLVMLQGGEHVMFIYEGLGTGVQEFILTVYGACTSMLNLTYHKDQGIERYHPAEDAKVGDRLVNLRCELLVPTRR